MKREKKQEERFEACLERGRFKAKEEKLRNRFEQAKLAFVSVGAIFAGLLVMAPWAGQRNPIADFYFWSVIAVGTACGLIFCSYSHFREQIREPKERFGPKRMLPYCVDGKVIFVDMPPLLSNEFEQEGL